MISASGTIVVVGSGQGGYQVATSLRDEGFEGRIVVVGEEPGLPYQRPPLSMAYLLGKADEAQLRLRAASFYDERKIELRHGERVAAIDREQCAVALDSGMSLDYDHLVLATGASNRPLPVPGAEFEGVVQLRTLADAEALKTRLAGIRRVAVVGAGFIGLEFAAVATALGIEVTVLEATSRPMSRALSGPMSDFFRDAHKSTGTRLLLGAVVTRVLGEGGRAVAVETGEDRVVPADLVVVAIGVVPNAELAEASGLPARNGILVDDHLVTADPAISAIGDCANFPCAFAGGAPTRLESVQNAVDGARAVAARLVGKPAPYAAVPWFWSDQGTLKLQIAGLAVPHGETVLRGDPATGSFSVFCYEGHRLLAVESVNRAADHMIARRLLARGFSIAPGDAGDPGFDLKGAAAALLAS